MAVSIPRDSEEEGWPRVLEGDGQGSFLHSHLVVEVIEFMVLFVIQRERGQREKYLNRLTLIGGH